MVTKDCYVERAMERLTVTTMRLCSDLLKMGLQEKPAPAGFLMPGGNVATVQYPPFLPLPQRADQNMTQDTA